MTYRISAVHNKTVMKDVLGYRVSPESGTNQYCQQTTVKVLGLGDRKKI